MKFNPSIKPISLKPEPAKPFSSSKPIPVNPKPATTTITTLAEPVEKSKPVEPIIVLSNLPQPTQLDFSDELGFKSKPALIINRSESKQIKPIPPEKSFDDCQFRGIIRKPNGEEFAGSAQIHQKHSRSFSCLDVIFMEQNSGRHLFSCIHTGYLSATKCCVKGKS